MSVGLQNEIVWILKFYGRTHNCVDINFIEFSVSIKCIFITLMPATSDKVIKLFVAWRKIQFNC